MRKRINTLNCLFGIMLTAIVIVPFSPLHAKANNHADISYHIPYSGTGVARTDLATKTDSTSVYIKHGGDRGVTVGIGRRIWRELYRYAWWRKLRSCSTWKFL